VRATSASGFAGTNKRMPVIYLGLGSNQDPHKYLRLAVEELGRRFVLQRVSPVYRNRPVGFEGADFLNAVARAETALSADGVCRQLEEIHELAGRKRGADPFVPRTLDIDLLLYDGDIIDRLQVPRPDILAYSFVLRPLAEIDPCLVHPVTGRTMADHWADFDADRHPLTLEALILSNPAG